MTLRDQRRRGSVVVEFVLLVPVFILMTLFIVHVGRTVSTQQRLTQVADSAARAASMVFEARQWSVASDVVNRELTANHVDCLHVEVTLRRVTDDGLSYVTAQLSCEVDVDGLGRLMVRKRRYMATSSEVVDHYIYRE